MGFCWVDSEGKRTKARVRVGKDPVDEQSKPLRIASPALVPVNASSTTTKQAMRTGYLPLDLAIAVGVGEANRGFRDLSGVVLDRSSTPVPNDHDTTRRWS